MKRTIVVSDLHYGAEKTPVELIADFFRDLTGNPPDRLILNGDIIEFWTVACSAARENMREFFRKFIAPLASAGTEVNFILGNHDFVLHHDQIEFCSDEDSGGPEEFRRDFFPDCPQKIHFHFPHMILRYPGEGGGEKHTLVTHGDGADFFHAFDRIGKVHLPEKRIIREDDWVRDILRLVQPGYLMDFYLWSCRYPQKREFKALDLPLAKITNNERALQFFAYLLSAMDDNFASRKNVSSFRVFDMMLMLVPLYGRELKGFIDEIFTLDLDVMGRRVVDLYTSPGYMELFSDKIFGELYDITGSNAFDPEKTTEIITGHLHRVGETRVEKYRVLFTGMDDSGADSGVLSYVEIDPGGNGQLKSFPESPASEE